jgi:1-acyl-sn-glycerol-3-phosphate acyltransferase
MAVSDDPRHGGADFGAPMTKGDRRFRNVAKLLVANGVISWFNRLEVVDHDKIPTSGPVIIAPSHRSNMDTPFMGASLKREGRFMTKESVFKSPFWTKFIVALGGFPVKRGTFDRETLNNAREILARGEMLVVFPEGARQEGPRIKPVFEGTVWIAAQAGVPIVPAGIGGSYGVMPIGVKLPRPKKVVVKFGDPMYVGDPGNLKRVPRSELKVAAAELRERLQTVFDEAQVLAGTPNRAWSEDEPGINDRNEPWADG